jgi:hypothetical protein
VYCPKGHCLCRTVQSESARIWNDLQDAETYNSPIHEDTITQTFALKMNRQHAAETRVHQFTGAQEKKNGSDFLWLFFNSSYSQHFRVAVQAKRLYPNGKYAAFKQSQATKLVRYASSKQALPIYALYNYSPFFSSILSSNIYMAGAKKNVWRRRILSGWHPTVNCGAIYVSANWIINSGKTTLTPRDVLSFFKPLWFPLCTCMSSFTSDPLDVLAASFQQNAGSEDTRNLRPIATSEPLEKWMSGRLTEDSEIEEAFLGEQESTSDPDGAFRPSFVIGMQLPSGET